jgi:hypothetical protein
MLEIFVFESSGTENNYTILVVNSDRVPDVMSMLADMGMNIYTIEWKTGSVPIQTVVI